jgi:hypothetical protein
MEGKIVYLNASFTHPYLFLTIVGMFYPSLIDQSHDYSLLI